MRSPQHAEPPAASDRLKAVAELLARGVLRLVKRRVSAEQESPEEFADSRRTCLDEGQKMSLNVPTG